MMTNLLYFALPLVIYLSLATLPQGRPAAMGLGVAVVIMAFGYFLAPNLGSALTLALAGVAMAAVAQAARAALGAHMPHSLYLALLGALPLAVLMILLLTVGD